MNLLITGDTGFIGRALCEYLQGKGYRLCVLTRDLGKASKILPNQKIRLISDLDQIQQSEKIEGVINLAGTPIVQRWTEHAKKHLEESRVHLTNRLVATLQKLNEPPQVLISGSAIGFYGPQGDELLTETSGFSQSFSHTLCENWEASANLAKESGIRVCHLRTGIVLGKEGGALKRMFLPFWLGLGGRIGNGKQWMSWIHLQDIIRTIEFCLEHPEIRGPVNATAPEPVTNELFTQCLGKLLHRPTVMTMPAFMVKIIFGQMGEELLLQGQRVVPAKLLQHNFTFQYPTLETALSQILISAGPIS